MCSCRIKYGISFYIAQVAPMVLIMIMNICIFVAVYLVLARKGKASGKKQDKKQLMRISISLSIILGLTWISGLLVLENTHPAPQWIFTILVAFQGFFLFIFQVASHRVIKKLASDFTSSGTKSTPVSGTNSSRSGDLSSSGVGYDGTRRRSTFAALMAMVRRTSSVSSMERAGNSSGVYSSSGTLPSKSRRVSNFSSAALDSVGDDSTQSVSAWDTVPAKKTFAQRAQEMRDKKKREAYAKKTVSNPKIAEIKANSFAMDSFDSTRSPSPAAAAGRRRSSAITALSDSDRATLEREARGLNGESDDAASATEVEPVKKSFAQRAREMRDKKAREAARRGSAGVLKQTASLATDSIDQDSDTGEVEKKLTFGERAAAKRRERMQKAASSAATNKVDKKKKKKAMQRQSSVTKSESSVGNTTVYVNVPTEELDAERYSPPDQGAAPAKRPLSIVDELKVSHPSQSAAKVYLPPIDLDNLTEEEQAAAAKKLGDGHSTDGALRRGVDRNPSQRSTHSVTSTGTAPLSAQSSRRQSPVSQNRLTGETDDEDRFTPAPPLTPESSEEEETSRL